MREKIRLAYDTVTTVRPYRTGYSAGRRSGLAEQNHRQSRFLCEVRPIQGAVGMRTTNLNGHGSIELDEMPSRSRLSLASGHAQDTIPPVSLPRENDHRDAKGSASGRLGVDGQEPRPPPPASFCASDSLLLASPPSD